MSQAGLFERDEGLYGRIRRRAPPPFNPAVLHRTIRTATASLGLSRAQQRRDCNVFVYIFPMYANALGDESPIFPLLGRRVSQAREPFQRRGYFASVRERNDERIISKTDVERENSRRTSHA